MHESSIDDFERAFCCRSAGSCAAATAAAESHWRGGSIVRHRLGSQSVSPLLGTPLLLLSGPLQPRRPQAQTFHLRHTQVSLVKKAIKNQFSVPRVFIKPSLQSSQVDKVHSNSDRMGFENILQQRL